MTASQRRQNFLAFVPGLIDRYTCRIPKWNENICLYSSCLRCFWFERPVSYWLAFFACDGPGIYHWCWRQRCDISSHSSTYGCLPCRRYCRECCTDNRASALLILGGTRSAVLTVLLFATQYQLTEFGDDGGVEKCIPATFCQRSSRTFARTSGIFTLKYWSD